MVSFSSQYSSPRAQKARIAAGLKNVWVKLLPVFSILFLVIAAALLYVQLSVGWFFIGIAAIPYMIYEWYKHELAVLAPEKTVDSIDDVLDQALLARLPASPTPYDVAGILMSITAGQFFAARFGLSPQFVQQFASHDQKDMAGVWEKAWEIKTFTESESISGGIVLLALLEVVPNYESLIAHLQLDIEDLYAGLHWYDHLAIMARNEKRIQKTGGLARDWSFGWTPMLNRFGANLSQAIGGGGLLLATLEAHNEAITQLSQALGGGARKNAVLVGPTGVGKTEIVHAFAEKLLDGNAKLGDNLLYRQVFILDASALISAAPGRGEIEQLVTQVLNEAFSAKNIIICLEDAQLFFEDGIGSVDISNLLLPVLTAGRLQMILTMDEQRYLKISQIHPEITNAVNRINIVPASKIETISVMQDHVLYTEFDQKVTFMYQSFKEAHRLSERYIHDLAMPGRALNLLDAAAKFAESGLVTEHSVQMAIEKTMGIKVSVASTEQDRDKLLHLEDLIHERMINQTHAVSVVSDAIRRARSGVRNQDRPIGTFLFLGPTGVGKTELAKAIADVYFGGENQMIRLDMNESVTQNDVARLIADGARDPNSLTAQVMKQPFSVILLDEIEKAHPSVLTTLLQLLDEGIMRDEKNKEVSFRDAIVIATSNAGADRIRELIDQGYDLEKVEGQFVDELINTNQFRPEFLNRFDEIVTFRPLNKPELIQVVDLILKGVNKTMALQKISVEVADDAKSYLVDAGYDPRLGARPMRRIVQRAVENTVAKQMLTGTVQPGSVIQITLEQVQALVSSKSQADAIATGAVPPPVV